MLFQKIVISVCWLFLFGFPELFAAKKQVPPPSLPPFCVSSQSRVFIDSSTEITLQSKGGINNESVNFFIRKPPNYGDLGEILRISNNSAIVRYTPRKGINPGSDSFTFAAQFQGSPVSAPAKVGILIEERPAKLDFITSLDFGHVPLGDRSVRTIKITNQGGALAKGIISAKDPWNIIGNSSYEIKGGDESNIQIQFMPIDEGDFADRLVVHSRSQEQPLYINLKGSCIKPVSTSKEGIVISSSMRSKNVGEITFYNHTEQVRSVKIGWPDFIEAHDDYRVPANGSVSLPVNLKKISPAFSHIGLVPFQSGNFSSDFRMVVQPASAHISIEPPSQLNLGEVLAGETAKGKLVAVNEGGVATYLKATMPSGVKILPDPSTTILEPNSKVDFDISWSLPKSGIYSTPLQFEVDGLQIAPINLQASAKAAKPVEKLLSVDNLKEVQKSQPEIFASIPPVTECFLVQSTLHSVKIKWKLTSPDTKDYIIERRVIKRTAQGMESWEKCNNVEVQISGEFATAYFRKLKPGTFQNIRLRGIDQAGNLGPPNSGHFRIQTKEFNAWTIPYWIWIPALMGGLGVGFIFLKKRFHFVVGTG